MIGDPIVKNVKPASDTTQLTRPRSRRASASGSSTRSTASRSGGRCTVYDATGAIIHQKTYYSNYARITGLTLIGAPRATATSTPTPTPPAP